MTQASQDIAKQLDTLFAEFNKGDQPGLVVAVAQKGKSSTVAASVWQA